MNSSGSKPKPLQFISPLHRANRQAAIFLAEKFDDLGVAAPEAHLLIYVHTYGPCAIGELVRVFGYKKPAMTHMLDRLERKKFVLRSVNPEDRRSFVVTTTEQGDSVAVEGRRRVEELDARIRRGVSAEDLQGFLNVVAAVASVTGIDVRKGEGPSTATPRRR
jgi:DNA-binding MarR family transcriptional regulator